MQTDAGKEGGRSGRERAGAKRAGKLPVRAGRKAPGMTRDRRTLVAQARVRGPTVIGAEAASGRRPVLSLLDVPHRPALLADISAGEPRFHVRTVVCRPDAYRRCCRQPVLARPSAGTIRGWLSAVDSRRY